MNYQIKMIILKIKLQLQFNIKNNKKLKLANLGCSIF